MGNWGNTYTPTKMPEPDNDREGYRNRIEMREENTKNLRGRTSEKGKEGVDEEVVGGEEKNE